MFFVIAAVGIEGVLSIMIFAIFFRITAATFLVAVFFGAAVALAAAAFDVDVGVLAYELFAEFVLVFGESLILSFLLFITLRLTLNILKRILSGRGIGESRLFELFAHEFVQIVFDSGGDFDVQALRLPGTLDMTVPLTLYAPDMLELAL